MIEPLPERLPRAYRCVLLAGLAAVTGADAVRPIALGAAPSVVEQLGAEFARAAVALIAALDAGDVIGWTTETALRDTAPGLRLARALVMWREAGQGDPVWALLAEQFSESGIG